MRDLHRHSYHVFAYNRRQKPWRIACPGGAIFLEREKSGTVAVTLVPDGSIIADHLGAVELRSEGGPRRLQGEYTVRLICEEVKP